MEYIEVFIYSLYSKRLASNPYLLLSLFVTDRGSTKMFSYK